MNDLQKKLKKSRNKERFSINYHNINNNNSIEDTIILHVQKIIKI